MGGDRRGGSIGLGQPARFGSLRVPETASLGARVWDTEWAHLDSEHKTEIEVGLTSRVLPGKDQRVRTAVARAHNPAHWGRL
jgi:hypothetical protein